MTKHLNAVTEPSHHLRLTGSSYQNARYKSPSQRHTDQEPADAVHMSPCAVCVTTSAPPACYSDGAECV